ncbi:MAG: hypothetical protein ABI702_08880 [Burkholderiales bacterium]
MDLAAYWQFLYQMCFVGLEVLFALVPFLRGFIWTLQANTPPAAGADGAASSRSLWVGLLTAPLSRLRDAWYLAVHRAPESRWGDLQSPERPDRIIVWIHGTWRKAASTAHEPLTQALAAAFPSAAIRLFHWQSRNLDTDRAAASEQLKAELMALAPSALPVTLIGHSHGGTVAASVTAALAGTLDIRAITLATPFISFETPDTPGADLEKLAQSAYSGLVPFHLASLAIGLAAGLLFWWSLDRSLPPIEGLLSAGASHVFASVMVAAFLGVAAGLARNATLDRRAKAFRSSWCGNAIPIDVAHRIVPLRADDDPLLAALSSLSRAAEQRTAASARRSAKAEAVFGSSVSTVTDMVLKCLVFVAALVCLPATFRMFARQVLQTLENDGQTRIAMTLFALAILGLGAVLIWRWPLRLLASLGMYATAILLNLWPRSLLLTAAQARAAGVPVALLLVGAIRISDAPDGGEARPIPTNGALLAVGTSKRHTEMLRLPSVIAAVVAAIQTSSPRSAVA